MPLYVSGLELRREDVVLGAVPFFYLLGLECLGLIPLVAGASSVLIPRFTPRNALETVEREKATILVGVPAMYNALAMLDDETLKRYDLSSLRVAFTAGAKSSAHVMEMLEDKFGITLCEVYGLTEFLIVSFGTIHNRKLGTAGKPVEDIKIVDNNDNEVPQGEVGEIIARSPQIMKGYYKMSDLTAQVFRNGWFHSGDLVRIDADGYIEYIEKKSFIIVTSAGVKIPPTEVEDLLLKHPSVAEAAYVGVTDEHKGQIPTAFIVPKEGQTVTKQEIRTFCRQSLANYKLPHKFEFIDNIPKTGSGKIDRRRLKERRTVEGV
jgi:long-chain acyl-CoA synthetase